MDDSSYVVDILSALSVLLILLGVLFGGAWLVRRFNLVPGVPLGPRGQSREVEVLETRALDPRNRLVLVRWRGHRYLLAVGQEGSRLIDRTPADTGGTFQDQLSDPS
ncbi:FliO/MopB family protein [Yunchengibacter salinarum]|uniref:FliO/MopB family protein n=1 Tax=Yunchengibacter salinarum TaxID=3133399 RepID=UPI0035B69F0A